jgi:hypothetical protein
MIAAMAMIVVGLSATCVNAQNRPASPLPLDTNQNQTGVPAPQSVASENQRQQAFSAFGNLPLSFIENHGQIDHRVRYYAQRGNFGVYFTADQVVFSLEKPPSAPRLQQHAASNLRMVPTALDTQQSRPSQKAALNLRFLGATANSVLSAEDRAPGEINYFRGNDPAHWQTGVPQYSQVVYRELWPGVDLKVQDHEKTLKYEFHLRPGAQVSNIRLAYSGASSVKLDGSGTLLVESNTGLLRDAAPVAYQEIAGKHVPVESRYVLNNTTGEYGFAVANYNPAYELIIDPSVAYSTFLGGTSHEIGSGIAVDSAGNTFIVGITQSPDFPATAGAFRRTGAAGNVSDVFVAKLNSTGSALIYATFIGGSDFDFGRAIAIDSAGNAYIAGQTKSANYPTTKGAFDTVFKVPGNCPRCNVDNYNAFVTKLNATGSALVYSTFLGGGQDLDDALGIAVDASGDAYVTGETASSDFPTTRGAFQTVKAGSDNAYVTKFNPTGSALVYSTFIGGSQVDFAVRIAVDASNNAYVTGDTSSPNFPTTAGAFDTVSNGSFDVFALKLNAAGSGLIYSTFLGGSGSDGAGGLTIDSSGNAYISGGTGSSDFPVTPGAFQTVATDPVNGDSFVTKLNPTGSALVYSTYLGSGGANGIALTAAGNVWITGATASATFPVTADAFQSTEGGTSTDGFVTELNATGSALIYSTYLGGANTDYGTDLKLDSAGNVYITGETISSDFPTTAGAFDRTFKGNPGIFWGDAFITKFTVP